MGPFISSELYQQIHQVMPIVCVDVVLKTPNNGFLLVKRETEPAKGQWWLVGGRVQRGETLEDAARRKVKEEVGINLSVLKKIKNVYETIFPTDPFEHGGGAHTINTCFIGELTAENLETLKLDSHHSEFQIFYELDQLQLNQPNQQINSYLKECLIDGGVIQDG